MQFRTTCDAIRSVSISGVKLLINEKEDPLCLDLVEPRQYSHIFAEGMYYLNVGDKLKFKFVGYKLGGKTGNLFVKISKYNL